MRAHELTEKISISTQRNQILQKIQPKVSEWYEMARNEHHDLKWIMLDDLRELFALDLHMGFDFEYFDNSNNFTSGSCSPLTGYIMVYFDPRNIDSGPINFLESPDLFVHQIVKTMTHELLHRSQLMASKISLNPGDADGNRDAYLALPHEIQAYAKDAADDLTGLYGGKDAVLQSIRKNGWRWIAHESDAMMAYRDTFHEDPDDPKSKVWKTFLRYFYFYLNEHA